MDTVTLTIDGRETAVRKGTTILTAARQLGISIPHYCWHPALSIAGSCRMCFVEVEKMPKLVTACSTPAVEGMAVSTNSAKVQQGRKGVLEFLLINHPLDCPECDQAGECQLQNYSFKYGSPHSRFREHKRERPPKDVGPTIKLYTNRCIMCSRCVRFGREIDGYEELGIFQRGGMTEIDIYPGRPLQNKLAGNVVDICPVGALVDKDYLHKSRVWNLTRTPSVCPGCATGCSIFLDALDNEIHRIRPRYNADVNGHWICDDGRYGNKARTQATRLDRPQLRKGETLRDVAWDEALGAVVDILQQTVEVHGPDSVAALGSATATNEENYILAGLFRNHFGTGNVGVIHRHAGGYTETFKSGFTIHADKNWNARGCADMLELPGLGIDSLLNGIRGGRIRALYILRNDLRNELPDEWIETFRKLEFLVVQDTAPSALTDAAHAVLSGADAYEVDGTVVSAGGQVQRVSAALYPPGMARQGWDILTQLSARLTGAPAVDSAGAVFNEIATRRSAYRGLTYYGLGECGRPLVQQHREAEAAS